MRPLFNFNLVAVLSGFSFFAFLLLIPIFTEQEMGWGHTATGIVLAAFSIGILIASPIWGHLSDKLGRRKIFLIAGNLLFSVTSLLHAFVEVFEVLLVIRFLQGIGFATFPMLTALFSDHFGVHAGRRFGSFSAANALGWGLGGVVAGVLADALGIRGVFVVVSVFPLLIAALVHFLLPESEEVGDPQNNLAQKVPGKFKFLYGMMFVRQCAAISLWAVFPIYLGTFVSSYSLVGFVSGINMLIQPIFMLLIGKFGEHRDKLQLMLIGLVGSVITFVVYGMAPGLAWIAVGQILIALSWSFIFIGVNLYIISEAPRGTRGRALGFFQASLTTAAAVGPLLGGAVSDTVGIRNMIFISSGLMLFSLPFLLRLKFLDRRSQITTSTTCDPIASE